MLRVGITGGIGSGKTALTDWLATQGIVIVDADLAARIVVEPGQPALAEIADTFGEEFLLPSCMAKARVKGVRFHRRRYCRCL